MKVYVEWHGCPFARIESEIAAEKLGSRVKKIEEADVILLFTCIVKQETEKRMVKRIKELRKSGKKLIIAGCMVDVMPELVRKLAPEAYLLGTDWVDMAHTVFERKELLGFRNITKLGAGSPGEWPIAIVPVAEGCVGKCSFCITKKARGNLASYPLEEIVKEIERVVKMGYREIWLTAQDIAVYGIDRGSNLGELLEAVLEIGGNFIVRLGMGNPKFFLRNWKKLKEALESERFFTMLHAPVQSGSEKVLRDMKRNHTAEDFKKLAKKFNRAFPEGSLHTDIIVGFPTETDRDFEDTVKLLKKTKPYKVNVSRYGKRCGTEAEKMKELAGWVVKERSRRISSLAKQIALEKNIMLVGEKVDVWIDEENAGRTKSYRQVLLRGSRGEWKRVEVWGATAGYLIAKGFYS